MAHADKASPAALASLAEEIGELLGGAGLAGESTPAPSAAKKSRRAASFNEAAAGPETSPAELVETFAVWTLDARALAPGRGAAKKPGAKKSGVKKSGAKGDRLSALARATGRWHHQIRVGGQAAAFARSAGPRLELDSASLGGLFVAPLARKVEEAIGWIDENEPEDRDGVRDPVVRLLVVPSHHLHAFWLFDEAEGTSEALIIDAPARFGAPARRRLLGEGEFLELLSRTRPVRGLG